jgi:hypothetical protein
MARLVNRGFVATLLVLAMAAELAVRAITAAPPHVVRVVYGTTLAMYMAVESRLRDAAPDVQVLALGDSLAMTQFQPDVFASDRGLPADAVFNAAYLAQTFRSQEMLLNNVGLDRLPKLKQVLMFVNPRRLTPEGNVDAPIFRVVDDPYSRLYGLSRYLVTAAWRQIGRPVSWDEVEYLSPYGGVVFDQPRPPGDRPVYLYAPIGEVMEPLIADLTRVIRLFRDRGINVVLLPNARHASINWFADGTAEAKFEARIKALASETGSTWVPIPAGQFQPPADTDFLDYGHLNRSGGIAFTHFLADLIVPIN